MLLLWYWVGGFETRLTQVSFSEFWTRLPWIIMLIYLGTTLAQAFVRALRYRLLIAAHRPEELPGIAHIYLVTLIRNMLVDLLPARLGELSYVALMNRRYRVNAGACVASLTVSFVFDLLALLALVVGVLGYQQLNQGLVGRLPVAVFALGLISFVALIGIYPLSRWLAPPISQYLDRPGAGRSAAYLGRLIALVNDALQSTARTGILFTTMIYSMGVRCIKYTGLYLLFGAVVVAFGESGFLTSSSVGTVLAALLSAEGAASLPLPAFMGFGVYEAGGTAALSMLGMSAGVALGIMLAVHILSQIIDYSVGGLATLIFINMTPKSADQKS